MCKARYSGSHVGITEGFSRESTDFLIDGKMTPISLLGNSKAFLYTK